MAEAIGKLLALFVDALTPRSVRVILLASVALNGYGWWRHEQALTLERQARQDAKEEMIGLRGDLKAWAQKTDEGNQELRAIRNLLMSRPTR